VAWLDFLLRDGKLPRKVAAIVKELCLVHQSELQDNWQRSQRFEPLDRIQGADRDEGS